MSTSNNENIILLVDCNAFFCSCERLFRPDLKNKPVGVLSNNDGCFVSRSKELKSLGVPMGAPFFQYKDICEKNKVAVFSSNFALYTNISDRVMKTLSEFSEFMEVYSVDEAFLNLKGFKPSSLFKTIEEYAFHIKTVVEKNTGIPVSIGLGPTKTLAKVANFLAKKNPIYQGVMSLMDSDARDIALAQVELDDIWGIGRALAPRLRALGLKTAKDFRDYENEKHILKLFSKVELYRKHELQGKLQFEFNQEARAKKQIMCSRSFGKDVETLKELQAAVAHHASSATEKLRRQSSSCRSVRVYLRTNRFKELETYYSASDEIILDVSTADSRKIVQAATELLGRLYKKGLKYKKVGVILGQITNAKLFQLSLFESQDSVRSINLMKSIDFINAKAGAETVKFAVTALPKKAWRMNQNSKSPRYVTGWSELPKVK